MVYKLPVRAPACAVTKAVVGDVKKAAYKMSTRKKQSIARLILAQGLPTGRVS